jgi:hypothetical protein
MKSNLLSALRKYRPRENHDPLENFITEAFAWLLQNHPLFGEFFLKKIALGLQLQFAPGGATIEWETQVHAEGLRPDMVGAVGERAFIFEHKAWSALRPNQIRDYRNQAVLKYGKENYHLILITAASYLIDQNPDLALCWHDVHAWIKEWQSHRDYEEEFLFEDFCQLLENEGMGPPAEISHAAVLSFLPAKNFLGKISDLIQRAAKYPWASLLPAGECKVHLPGHHGRLWGDDKYGFIGFYLLGDSSDWSPSISVGFFHDPRDYHIEWSSPSNPDFSINLDFNIQLHPNYADHPLYRRMVEDLSQSVARSQPEFDFLDHLATTPNPNRWHPLHIRMPMLELLRGTRDAEEQRLRLIGATSSILKLITDCQPFWELRAELRKAAAKEKP